MSESHVLSVVVPRPIDQAFTYKVPDRFVKKINIGNWVLVPFGRQKTHAFVVQEPTLFDGAQSKIDFDSLKDIIDVGDAESQLPQDVFLLCQWASKYYGYPLGELLATAAPTSAIGLKAKKSNSRTENEVSSMFYSNSIELTDHQKTVLKEIQNAAYLHGVHLLHGETGSGKTEIYIELARQYLAQGQGVIILVPEIGLTPQLHKRFEERLGQKVAVWHSALSDGKRREEWLALTRGEIKIVVGARSSIFAPVKNLGLIIVDEEHDASYKQEDRARYHARDLAVVRGQMSKALTLLGSASPSLETLERVGEGKYRKSILLKTKNTTQQNEIRIVSLAEKELVQDCRSILAQETLSEIKKTLETGNQVMIFLNRRGFASFLICKDCGDVPTCKNCSVSMKYHKKSAILKCHICGHVEKPPEICQKCQSYQIETMGAGTESLEEDLEKLIPDAKILRFDRDQITSASRLEKMLNQFRSKKANVLVGTQMLVKGHDFPDVTLVVVVLADSLFRWPDFRAAERAYQTLMQVSGRSGRGDQQGKVLIQTFQEDHPVLKALMDQKSRDDFYENERELRKLLDYPPFARLARLRLEHSNAATAKERSEIIVKSLTESAQLQDGSLEILGPSEAFLERIKGVYRWDILVKSKKINDLQIAVRYVKRYCSEHKWALTVDVDPEGTG